MSYLVSCNYTIIPLSDVILPPLSSKVVKYVVDIRGGFLGELSRSKRPFKPLSISPLFLGGKPLISCRVDGPPLTVSSGTPLRSTVSIAFSDHGIMDELASTDGTFETPYGRFRFSIDSIEVLSISSLNLSLSRVFTVEFVTPTILTAKYMIPPPLKHKANSLPEKHRLIPQPSFMFSYLLNLWNSVVSPEERIPNKSAGSWEAYKLGRLADITLVELNYRIRPAVAVIGKDSKGRARVAKGFIGWVEYECVSSKLLQVYSKLLTLATYLGVGRSRGIGLGLIKVRTHDEGRSR